MRFIAALSPLIALVLSAPALASSHREAPWVANDAPIDITDVYAFKTPGNDASFTFIMNVYPAAQAYAGPNWYQFAEDAIYEIKIDTTGDAVEDVSYRFLFDTADYMASDGLIVANFPSVKFEGGRFTGSLNQTYNVYKVDGRTRKGKKTQIGTNVPVAPPRIGPYTTDNGGAAVDAASALADDEAAMYANYKALADNAIISADGRKFFAGPRNDPFFVDLGGVFDRVSVRIPGVTGTPKDSLLGANVMTIAIEVPITDFLNSGERHFGVWATTSRPQGRALRTNAKPWKNGGAWVQVARLGNPLVNELVIKFKDKNHFNYSEPKDDAANYAGYVAGPQLAYVLNILYSGDGALTAKNFITPIAETGRDDLVAAFVTGLPKINKHPKATATGGDMIRVNLDFAIQEWPLSGRKLTDDVVKSTLAFLAQCTKLVGNTGTPDNPFGKVAPPATGVTPANCLLDDFVTADTKTPGNPGETPIAGFPYMDLPYSAYGKRN